MVPPPPTTRQTLLSNHPTPKPTPPRIRESICHHKEQSHPSSFRRPPSSPYLAFKTRYHNPSLSINILQLHFPNNAKLNSCNFLTPKPPSSLGKQTESQSTQTIFLKSSPPPQKYLLK